MPNSKNTCVFVKGMNGLPLMPTTPREARILVKEKKAHVISRNPYAIQLDYKTGTATQAITVGADIGQKHEGIGVVFNGNVIYKAEHTFIPTMDKKERITARKEFRQGRRYRKTEYREPKWKPSRVRRYHEEPVEVKRNGKRVKKHWVTEPKSYESSRPEGWLPPSIASNADHNINELKKIMSLLPSSAELTIELGKFDIQKMNNPGIEGVGYQQGPAYYYSNRREYHLALQGYKCPICDHKFDKEHKAREHHWEYVSKGASDSWDDIILVCSKCHTHAEHMKGGELDKLRKKISRMKYTAPTFMNATQNRIKEAFPEAKITYGYITAVDRENLGLRKTHANDAVAIAVGSSCEKVNDNRVTFDIRQVRRKKRSLHEATPRKGKNGVKNTEAKRNDKNTKRACRVEKKTVIENGKKKTITHKRFFYLYDTVEVYGKKGYISGFSGGGKSARVVDWNGNYIKKKDKDYSTVQLTELKLLERRTNNYISRTIKADSSPT